MVGGLLTLLLEWLIRNKLRWLCSYRFIHLPSLQNLRESVVPPAKSDRVYSSEEACLSSNEFGTGAEVMD